MPSETDTTATTETPEAQTPHPADIAPELVTATQPKRKWHDSKWKLGAVIGVVAFVVGFGTGAGESESLKVEAKADAERIVDDARDERDDIEAEVSDLESKRDEIEAGVVDLERRLNVVTKKAANSFEGSGIYMVPADVKPGTYKAAASPGCYYAVLRNLTGTGDDIINNGNVDGPVVVQVPSGAAGVEVSNCSTFVKVG